MSWPEAAERVDPRIEATVARPISVTAASRTPVMISGTASGSSTRQQALPARVAHASAASRTSRGTPWNPATMFRNRISSVYVVSGMNAASIEKPEDGHEQRERREAGDRVQRRR